MSHWRDLFMLNTRRAPVGNKRIFIRIWIRILHVVQSADSQIRIILVAATTSRITVIYELCFLHLF